MKRFGLLLVAICLLLAGNLRCQEYLEPQWKFHFAFEDGTGARDTVWLYLDSGISSWWPYEYNSYGIFPISVPSDTFSVYTGYSSSEFGKIAVGNIEWPMDVYLLASNYTLPITLSWDTALFNAPVLQETEAGPICNPRMDNQWFFFQTNAPWLHNQYSMIFDTQVVLPEFWWGDQNHFPIFAAFGRGHNCNPMSTTAANLDASLQLYPNPSVDFLVLRSDAVLQAIDVYDLHGRKVLQLGYEGLTGAGNELRIDVSVLPTGMYMLHARDAQGRTGVKKFVKGG